MASTWTFRRPWIPFRKRRKRFGLTARQSTFMRECSAEVTTSATMVRSAGKLMSATALSLIATLSRSGGMALSATVSLTGTISRQTGKIFSITKSLSATMLALPEFFNPGNTTTNQSVSAAVTISATLVKQAMKILTATALSLTASLTATLAEFSGTTLARVKRGVRSLLHIRRGGGQG